MKQIKNFLVVVAGIIIGLAFLQMRYGLLENVFAKDMTQNEKMQYIEQLRQGMLEKKQEIVLEYRGSSEEMEKFVMASIEEAFMLDKEDTSSDGDYMRYVHSASHVNMNGFGKKYEVRYSMEYLETKEQTEQVEREVEKILSDEKIAKKSDYGKIKAIHDYIINHVTYDMSTKFNSPYYALIKGTSACQGYATLMYKMATETGIPCCVITGKAKGSLHAWNLVKLDGEWYHVDATWDDPVGAFGETSMQYNFFLKSDGEMREHVVDEEFCTDEFKAAHPIAKKGYQLKK